MKLSLAAQLIEAHIVSLPNTFQGDPEIVSIRYEDGSGYKFLFQLAGESRERYISLFSVKDMLRVVCKATEPIGKADLNAGIVVRRQSERLPIDISRVYPDASRTQVQETPVLGKIEEAMWKYRNGDGVESNFPELNVGTIKVKSDE